MNAKFLLRQTVLLGVAIVVLWLLAGLVDWASLQRRLREADSRWITAATLLSFTFPILNALRWIAVLRAAGEQLPFGRVLIITWACWPVGTLTPGKAGELLKAAAVPNRTVGLGAALAERVVDLAVLGAYGIVFGALWSSWGAIAGGLLGWAAVTAFCTAAVLAPKLIKKPALKEKLEGLLAVGGKLFAQPRWLGLCTAASATNWFMSMLQLWVLLKAFGADASLGLIVAILPAATFAGLVPITPAGMGTRDGALLLLGAGRIDQAALLAASVVYTFVGYFMLSIIGLPFLWKVRPGKQ